MSSKNCIIPVFLAFTLALSALGCGAKMKEKELTMDAHFYFNRGQQEMTKKNYPKAVEDFQTVVESFSGSEIVDEALYNLAEAHFKNEEYLTAAYEYERVYTDYPSSQYAAEAEYKKALSYSMESPQASLDQENTHLAIDEFSRFIENYPNHQLVADAQKRIDELREKLAYKEYLAAELYYKMKHWDASIIYYKSIIKEFPRSTWVDDSQFGLGLSYMKKKEYDKASEIFNKLTTEKKTDPGIKKKAGKQLAEIQKYERKNGKK